LVAYGVYKVITLPDNNLNKLKEPQELTNFCQVLLKEQNTNVKEQNTNVKEQNTNEINEQNTSERKHDTQANEPQQVTYGPLYKESSPPQNTNEHGQSKLPH